MCRSPPRENKFGITASAVISGLASRTMISTGIATASAMRSGDRAASTFGVYSPNSAAISGIAIRLTKYPQLPNVSTAITVPAVDARKIDTFWRITTTPK